MAAQLPSDESGTARPARHRALHRARAAGDRVSAQPSVPVDGNVLRVMARLHRVEARSAAMPLASCAIWPARLACAHRPGEVAQALMDLGATVCRPRRPRLPGLSLAAGLQAHAAGIAERLPRRAPRRARPVRRGLAFLLARPDGAILFRRRPAGGLARRPARTALQPVAGRAAGDRAGARPRARRRRPGACTRSRLVTASPISSSSSTLAEARMDRASRSTTRRERSGARPPSSTGWRCRP